MYIRVHVTPDAKKERVTKTSDTEFYIMVREPASQNLANRRIIAIIAELFSISPTQVRILTGHRSSSKMVSVEV
jgi:uncharacterized protein (TIGR00251 family)